MITISDSGVISLTRGDTANFPLFIDCGSKTSISRYVLKDDDTIYFAIMRPNQPFEFSIVRKVYTRDDIDDQGDVVIELKPEDTECLCAGLYYYTVKLRTQVGETYEVQTLIQNTKFFIEN